MDITNEGTQEQLDQEGADLLLSVGRMMAPRDRHEDGLRSDDVTHEFLSE